MYSVKARLSNVNSRNGVYKRIQNLSSERKRWCGWFIHVVYLFFNLLYNEGNSNLITIMCVFLL